MFTVVSESVMKWFISFLMMVQCLQADHPKLNFKDKYSESYRDSHPTAPVVVPWMSGVISAWAVSPQRLIWDWEICTDEKLNQSNFIYRFFLVFFLLPWYVSLSLVLGIYEYDVNLRLVVLIAKGSFEGGLFCGQGNVSRLIKYNGSIKRNDGALAHFPLQFFCLWSRTFLKHHSDY